MSGLSGEVRQLLAVIFSISVSKLQTSFPRKPDTPQNLKTIWNWNITRNINPSRIGGSLLSVLCIQLPLISIWSIYGRRGETKSISFTLSLLVKGSETPRVPGQCRLCPVIGAGAAGGRSGSNETGPGHWPVTHHHHCSGSLEVKQMFFCSTTCTLLSKFSSVTPLLFIR